MQSGDGYSLRYNLNGNPTSIDVTGSGTWNLTYDGNGVFENRLTRIRYPDSSSNDFAYNGDGLRVKKLSTPPSPGAPGFMSIITDAKTVCYVYDGATVIAETDGYGALTAYYTPGVGLVRPGTPTTKLFYQESALGSTLGVADAAGTLSSRYEYDAFGITYTLLAGQKTPYRFAGKHGYYGEDESQAFAQGRLRSEPEGRCVSRAGLRD